MTRQTGNGERAGRRLPDAAVFDLDGVITGTARIHYRAWKETFDALLRRIGGGTFLPFEHDRDYVPYVDGKPRYEGVAAFLASRSIDLPEGRPDDPAGARTVCGVGNEKNRRFGDLIAAGDIPVFDSTVRLVDALADLGVPCAVASSSRNCRAVLEATDLASRFRAVVDGTDSRELGLAGKPAPDIFITACERLGADPGRSIMVEDAYSGVEAGRNGGFGLVIGVARNGDVEGLRSRGAHIVVQDLGEITLDDVLGRFCDRLSG